MCGRYVLQQTGRLQERFAVGFEDFHDVRLPPVAPRFNIAPRQEVPTVLVRRASRKLVLMRWGFEPAWLTGRGIPPFINAKAESLLEKPLWRGVLRNNRCLIPADGFYEWQKIPGVKAKQPIHLRLSNGALFAFAGLFAQDANGDLTCAIVTTAANSLVAPIHSRMPVILAPEDEAVWLDGLEQDPRALVALLQPYPAEAMAASPASPDVGNVRNEGPELLKPAIPHVASR